MYSWAWRHLFKRQADWLQRAFPPFLQVIFQLLVMNKTGLIIFNNMLRKCVAQACSSQQLTQKFSLVGAESHTRGRLLGFGTGQDGGISHNKAVFWLVFISLTPAFFPLLLVKTFGFKAEKNFSVVTQSTLLLSLMKCGLEELPLAPGWIWARVQHQGEILIGHLSFSSEMVVHSPSPWAEFLPWLWVWGIVFLLFCFSWKSAPNITQSRRKTPTF